MAFSNISSSGSYNTNPLTKNYLYDSFYTPTTGQSSNVLPAGPLMENGSYYSQPGGSITNTGDVLGTGSSGSGNIDSSSAPNITSTSNVNGANISYTDDGNILGLSALKKTQGYLDWAKKTGGTGAEYLDWLNGGGAEQQLIDESFDAGNNFLNQQENSLNSNYNNFLNTFTAPYDAQVPLINQAVSQGQAGIDAAKGDVVQNEQSALDAARRLYQELSQRNSSAFGSGALSSVGQAASELLGRETSRQFGQVRQTATNAVNSLIQKGIDLKNQAEAQLQSLEIQKNQAISQAKIAFQEKLDEINSKRFELGQNKAAAKLQALQAFRDQMTSIQMQATQFAQSLQAMKVEADLNLRNALATAQGSVSGALSSAGDTVNNFVSGAQAGQNQTQAGNAITGNSASGTPFGLPFLSGLNAIKNYGDDKDKFSSLPQ